MNDSKVIGVYGHIGSGKSHFSKLISEKFHYVYLDCDKIFKEQILSNELFRKSATKFFNQIKINAFVDGEWNVKELRHVLFIDEVVTNEFNEIVRTFLNPILQEYIRNNARVLIEMSTILDNPIKHLCDKIFYIGYERYDVRIVLDTVQKRNPGLKEGIIIRVLNYQNRVFSKNTKDQFSVIYSRDFSDKWNSEEHLLEQFRESF